MKKIYLLLISMLMAFTTIGCSNDEEKIQSREDDKIQVYTTIFPIYDFARNIGKDKIDLNYIIPPGTEPHSFEITPKVLKDIQNADLLIKNGLGIDSFIDKVENESDLEIVVATDGINPLSYDEEHSDEEHSDEEHSDETCSHNHGQHDPHVWLDIDLAIKQCENIKNSLIQVDEKNKEYYEQNYNEYVKSLNELKQKYEDNLKNIKNNNIVVSHDAYGYLCEVYNINQISITGITPNQEPSLSKISEISNMVKETNVEYILFDGLVNPKVAKTIADECNIETKILYSIDGVSKDDFDNGESYISLMDKNLETLKLILK
ncbi:MAG: metal ABC transporter solute-binding protein, Zn/Mn family [Paraclostridium sp.]